jgi:tetratricopeptide (TPR) repeat protein
MKKFHAKKQRKEMRRNSLRLCVSLCAFARNCFYVFVFFTLSAHAQSPEPRALLHGYIETGRYAEAEATAKRFLQKSPDAGPVHHELAEVLAITGRYTEAISEFERAATDPTIKLESDLRRAEVLDLIGQEDRAKVIYE